MSFGKVDITLEDEQEPLRAEARDDRRGRVRERPGVAGAANGGTQDQPGGEVGEAGDRGDGGCY